MKFFSKRKDGGPYSKVTGYWLCEIKSAFSIALLRFDRGSRESFHTHAFDCISWVLKGKLEEHILGQDGGGENFDTAEVNEYPAGLKPIITRRSTFHKVYGRADTTWVLTFRGPWADRWREYLPSENRFVTLTHGRKEIE